MTSDGVAGRRRRPRSVLRCPHPRDRPPGRRAAGIRPHARGSGQGADQPPALRPARPDRRLRLRAGVRDGGGRRVAARARLHDPRARPARRSPGTRGAGAWSPRRRSRRSCRRCCVTEWRRDGRGVRRQARRRQPGAPARARSRRHAQARDPGRPQRPQPPEGRAAQRDRGHRDRRPVAGDQRRRRGQARAGPSGRRRGQALPADRRAVAPAGHRHDARSIRWPGAGARSSAISTRCRPPSSAWRPDSSPARPSRW